MDIWLFEPELGLLALHHLYNYIGAENQKSLTSEIESSPVKQRRPISRIYTDNRQVVPSDLDQSGCCAFMNEKDAHLFPGLDAVLSFQDCFVDRKKRKTNQWAQIL